MPSGRRLSGYALSHWRAVAAQQVRIHPENRAHIQFLGRSRHIGPDAHEWGMDGITEGKRIGDRQSAFKQAVSRGENAMTELEFFFPIK